MPQLGCARISHLRCDGDRCTGSTTTCWAFVLGICACLSLFVVALPLHTAGYNWRVATNGALAATTCTVANHVTTASVCSRQCQCVPVAVDETCTSVATPSGGTRRMCTTKYKQKCITCKYPCYDAYWNVTYTAEQEQQRGEPAAAVVHSALVHENKFGRYEFKDIAIAALQRQRPVDSSSECYYNQASPRAAVVFTRYQPAPFLVFAIVFYALTALCVAATLLCLVLSLRAACWFTLPVSSTQPLPDVLGSGRTQRRRRRRRRSSKSLRSMYPPAAAATAVAASISPQSRRADDNNV